MAEKVQVLQWFSLFDTRRFCRIFYYKLVLSHVTHTINPIAAASSKVVGGIVFHPIIIIVTALIARRKSKTDDE